MRYSVPEERIHLPNPADPFGLPKEGHLVPLWPRGRKVRGPQTQSPAELAKWVAALDHSPVERLLSIPLDQKMRPLGVVIVSQGTVNESVAHPREIFAPAIESRAVGLVLAHNHPSGDPTPSNADRTLTRRVREAGDVLGIPLLDHLVIGKGGAYTSLAELGEIPKSNPRSKRRKKGWMPNPDASTTSIWSALRKKAASIDGALSKITLSPCAEAEKEHLRSKRQYAHAWHHPRVVCHAKSLSGLPVENQAGILAHELGHCYAIMRGLRHTEADANRLGSYLCGLEVRFSGPQKLEKAEVPAWLTHA